MTTMLRDLDVPFVPSAIDCLSWSEDGELAIAAAEYVHVLVCLDLHTEAVRAAVDL